jgi:ankyrin repeat protein
MKLLKPIGSLTFLLLVSAILHAQAIFDAVNTNDLSKVSALIEKDPSIISLKDNLGNTPLHNAAITGSVAMAEILLSKGADINAVNTRMNIPLVEAIVNKREEVSRLLIERGSDLSKRNLTGDTPLHFAVRVSSVSIVSLLIEKGAEIESKNDTQMTSLYLASGLQQNVEIIKLLIEKGANVNNRGEAMALGGFPLNYAADYGTEETVNFLLDHGADFDTANGQARRMISTAASRGFDRLFKAVSEKCGEALFNNGTNNKRLMRAAQSGGSLEIVKQLQMRNIPIDLAPNISGWTSLHYAAARNNPAMMEFLVHEGADMNARTNDGKSACNIAEEGGYKELLTLILKIGGTSEPQRFPVLQGPYLGQQPPGNEMKRFAPGIVESDHSSVCTSPDGNEMYWSSGPNIMVTRIVNGKWIKPEVASFSGQGTGEFYDDVPFISPDNKKLFFTSRRAMGIMSNKENIWYVERLPDGWSEPKSIENVVNAFILHWQISIAKSGTLYFGGISSDGYGGGDIYCSGFVDGAYTKPINPGSPINDADPEIQPYIAPDESYIL